MQVDQTAAAALLLYRRCVQLQADSRDLVAAAAELLHAAAAPAAAPGVQLAAPPGPRPLACGSPAASSRGVAVARSDAAARRTNGDAATVRRELRPGRDVDAANAELAAAARDRVRTLARAARESSRRS